MTVHQRLKDGSLVEGERQPPPVVTFFSGGGGLSSTAGNYLRFVRMFLNDGSLGSVRILAPETVALMAENHIGELEAGTLKSLVPDLTNDVDLFPGSADGFGLGFLLNADPVAGGRSAGSLAWAGIYNTYFWIDREQQVAGVLMLQILPFFDADGIALLEEFERTVYAVLG